MSDERTYTYKDLDVFYRVDGDNKNDAIVFLHPAFGDSSLYKYQMAHFGDKYFVVAVDMPGHGRSQLGRSSVNMGDMPAIVRAILAEHGADKAHMVGVSLGSLVAQGVAFMYPEMVQSVSVVGGYSIHKNNKHIARAQYKEMGKWIHMVLFNMNKFRKYVVDMSVHSEEGKAVLSDAVTQFNRASFRGMGGMGTFMVDTDAPMKYPLLTVCGELDTQLAKDACEKMAEAEPNAQYEEIAGAGHCANIDAPEQFNAVLEAFIERV